MTLKNAESNQHGSDNMVSTNAVTHSELLRVVQALEANTKLCTTLAEGLGGYDAEQMQGYNKVVSGLSDDLESKIRAQDGLQKDIAGNTHNEATEHADVVAQAFSTEGALAALVKAVSDLQIQSFSRQELTDLHGAILKLGESIAGRLGESECKDTPMEGDDDAAPGPSGLQHQITQLDLDLEQANHFLRREIRAVREEVASMNDTVAKQSVVTAIWSDVRAMNGQLQSLRQLVAGYNPFADRIEKGDVKELKDSIAALRAEVAELKKN